MNTVFSQAVNETFPQLDQSLKDEISQKVTEHMLESLKDEAYRADSQGLNDLSASVLQIQDINERSKIYGEQIIKKLGSLPENEQKVIMDKLDAELTRVMHQVYQAYSKG